MSDSVAAAVSPEVDASGVASTRRGPAWSTLLFPVLLVAVFWIVTKTVASLYVASLAHLLAMLIGPLVLLVGFAVWLFVFSRRSWSDVGYGILAMLLATTAAALLAHSTMRQGLYMIGLPTAMTAWVIWLVVSHPLPQWLQRWGLAFVLAGTWGYFTLLRLDGLTGAIAGQTSWRWTPRAEDVFLRELAVQLVELPIQHATESQLVDGPGDWPQFRGPRQDSRLTGVRINPNWDASPPKLLWKKRIGPAWSSFAVVGDRLFTQEQRGDKELVSCYSASDGSEIWLHEDSVRHTDIEAGAGPRATPTFHKGRLFTLGGTGILNCLDASTGKVVWSRNIATDADVKPPNWGYSGSPLVYEGRVIVFAGLKGGDAPGQDRGAVIAYRVDDGGIEWRGGAGRNSYCTVQLETIDGVPQLLSVSEAGVDSLSPTDGSRLWQFAWEMSGMQRMTQAVVLSNGGLILPSSYGYGTKRARVTQGGREWSVAEEWLTKELKPYYNDFVVVDGNAFGFDNEIFTCVDLATGKRRWKGGRYGNGQVLLLADQKLLLVLGEQGEVVLLEANPGKRVELHRFQAIEGKTWNHPVIAHGKLHVRNGEEMAAFQLELLDDETRPTETEPPESTLPRDS